MRKAYNTIVPSARRFLGWWADVTPLVVPGTPQTLTLRLPPPADWQMRVGAIGARDDAEALPMIACRPPPDRVRPTGAGDDVEVLPAATVRDAKARCAAMARCDGLTFRLDGTGAKSCAAALETAALPTKVYLKSSLAGSEDHAWCSLTRPPALEGVHFENVETVYTRQLASAAAA